MANRADPNRLGAEHWHALAKSIGMRPQFVARTISSMIDAIREAMPAAREELEEEHGALPMLQQPEEVIRTQLRIAGT